MCAGWQAAGFPQESATNLSTATSSFISDSLNIRGRPRTMSSSASLLKSSTSNGAPGTKARVNPAPVTTTCLLETVFSASSFPPADSRKASVSGAQAPFILQSFPFPRLLTRGRRPHLFDVAPRPSAAVFALATLEVDRETGEHNPVAHLEVVSVDFSGTHDVSFRTTKGYGGERSRSMDLPPESGRSESPCRSCVGEHSISPLPG